MSAASPTPRFGGSPRRHHHQPQLNGLLIAASYARFSSRQQEEKSNDDQQRDCRAYATSIDLVIAPELEFADAAISGTKRDRPGLAAMLAAAAKREFNLLIVFSLSRLARDTAILIPMLKQLIHNDGVRVVSTSENFDSARDNWEMLMHVMAIVHERYIKDLRANSMRGMEGALLEGFSLGDYCVGYTSQPATNGAMKGRGRNAKPRMVYAIDEGQAKLVRLVFDWFVEAGWWLSKIARELNRRGIEKDHRSTNPMWSAANVRQLLKNPKYIGLWTWGDRMNVRDPLTGSVTQELRPEEDPLRRLRDLPELRLVDDATWSKAQVRLADNAHRVGAHRRRNGELRGSAPDCGRAHFFGSMLRCTSCGRHLHVGGVRGEYMFCPSRGAGCCGASAYLPREHAKRMVITTLEQQLRDDQGWRLAVSAVARAQYALHQSRQPQERARLEAEIEKHKACRARICKFIAESDCSDPELSSRLAAELQLQTNKERELRKLVEQTRFLMVPLTAEWIDQRLVALAETIASGEAAGRDRLLQLLGGPIPVTQVTASYTLRPIWRGELELSVARCVAAILPGVEIEVAHPEDRSIVLNFWAARPKTAELLEEAWNLLSQDLSGEEIAEKLGLSKGRVSVVLQQAAQLRGLSPEEYRELRRRIKREKLKPTLDNEICTEVLRLYNDDQPVKDIVELVGISKKRVCRILDASFAARGEKRPDERTRRAQLGAKPNRQSQAVGGSSARGNAAES